MKSENVSSAGASPPSDSYYQRVAAYYDFDSKTFETRASKNLVLRRLRDEFRRESEPFVRGRILEIGFGPGLDLVHWGETHPESEVFGIDVSPGMRDCAENNIRARGLRNVRTAVGTVEDLSELFPQTRFDFVYCYFGALNTTEDLRRAARGIHQILAPDGVALLTFVNRWYLLEFLYGLLRLRWRRAFARLRPVWGGYSSERTLESRCLSPREIRRAFDVEFNLVRRRGYCILYPAWYRNSRWVVRHPSLAENLWRGDRLLNATPLWPLGEYALYVLRPRPSPR